MRDKEKQRLINKAYRKNNKEKIKEYRKKHHKKIREYKKEHYKNNKERIRTAQIKRKYDLSTEQINIAYEMQRGKCLICTKVLASPFDIVATINKKLQIDHCHVTGAARGLLCFSCNTKLGWFENRRNLILSYLER